MKFFSVLWGQRLPNTPNPKNLWHPKQTIKKIHSKKPNKKNPKLYRWKSEKDDKQTYQSSMLSRWEVRKNVRQECETGMQDSEEEREWERP